MDTFDAFAPPRSTSEVAPGPASTATSPEPSDPAPAGEASALRPTGRPWAVGSLGLGLAAVLVAGLGGRLGGAVGSALPAAVLAGVLGVAGVAAAVVALVRSSARLLDTTLLGAAGAASAAVAGVLGVAAVLLPVGPGLLDGDASAEASSASSAERVPEDTLDDLTADALPLGRATPLGADDVAVAAVLTDADEVTERLRELSWVTSEIEDLGGLDDVTLVEIDAPVESSGWAELVEDGDVSVLTADGVPYGTLRNRGDFVYEVADVYGPDAHGVLRGRVVVAVPMPPAAARGGTVVVLSPGWTDMATWAVPAA